MANCHHIFQEYNSRIRLSDEKRESLIKARNSLRQRIGGSFFKISKVDNHQHQLEFQSQGSYVMDTIIQPKDDDFDLDDGVYFIGLMDKDRRPTAHQFHKWIIESIGSFDRLEKVIDKTSCVRVIYKNLNGDDAGFHIDLPCYCTNNYKCPELGCLENDWVLSNPVEFIAWFEEKTKSGFQKEFLYEALSYKKEYRQWQSDVRQNDIQLRRIVRYLKGWRDELRGDMPPGVVMTILAGENYSPN